MFANLIHRNNLNCNKKKKTCLEGLIRKTVGIFKMIAKIKLIKIPRLFSGRQDDDRFNWGKNKNGKTRSTVDLPSVLF